jgi:hypothetical protein
MIIGNNIIAKEQNQAKRRKDIPDKEFLMNRGGLL